MTEETELSPEARRAAHRAAWDARLLPVLTAEWQTSSAIALQLGEKKASVLTYLKEMAKRDLAERRIVERPAKNPRKKKRRRTQTYDAEFRLAVPKA